MLPVALKVGKIQLVASSSPEAILKWGHLDDGQFLEVATAQFLACCRVTASTGSPRRDEIADEFVCNARYVYPMCEV
jgi:hypothetical protein